METRVIFANKELREAFELLEKKDQRLRKEIENALDSLKQNAFLGRNVKKI